MIRNYTIVCRTCKQTMEPRYGQEFDVGGERWDRALFVCTGCNCKVSLEQPVPVDMGGMVISLTEGERLHLEAERRGAQTMVKYPLTLAAYIRLKLGIAV